MRYMGFFDKLKRRILGTADKTKRASDKAQNAVDDAADASEDELK